MPGLQQGNARHRWAQVCLAAAAGRCCTQPPRVAAAFYPLSIFLPLGESAASINGCMRALDPLPTRRMLLKE